MWLIAWRNLWRNRGRTLISMIAIALTLAMFLLTLGMGDDQHSKLEASAVRTAGGSILIHGDGFWEAQATDVYIPNPEAVISAVTGLDGVTRVIPRVVLNGLVDSPRGSTGVRLSGIDAEAEAELFDYEPYLVDGTFLGGDEDNPIVLGLTTVEDLEVELGDRIVMTTTDIHGEVTRALFRLSGVVDTGSESMDGAVAFTTIDAAREAVGMTGELTQVALVLGDDAQRYEIEESVMGAVNDLGELEVLRWDEAIPDMLGYIEIDNAFNLLYMWIIFIVVAFGVANTFLMSVMERIRELGLLQAIGMTPVRVAKLVLYETTLLAVIAIFIGFLLGFAGHSVIAAKGIDISEMMGGEMEISGVAMTESIIRSEFNAGKWFKACLAVFALVLGSAAYPAFKATRMEPAQAMRTFQ